MVTAGAQGPCTGPPWFPLPTGLKPFPSHGREAEATRTLASGEAHTQL